MSYLFGVDIPTPETSLEASHIPDLLCLPYGNIHAKMIERIESEKALGKLFAPASLPTVLNTMLFAF